MFTATFVCVGQPDLLAVAEAQIQSQSESIRVIGMTQVAQTYLVAIASIRRSNSDDEVRAKGS